MARRVIAFFLVWSASSVCAQTILWDCDGNWLNRYDVTEAFRVEQFGEQVVLELYDCTDNVQVHLRVHFPQGQRNGVLDLQHVADVARARAVALFAADLIDLGPEEEEQSAQERRSASQFPIHVETAQGIDAPTSGVRRVPGRAPSPPALVVESQDAIAVEDSSPRWEWDIDLGLRFFVQQRSTGFFRASFDIRWRRLLAGVLLSGGRRTHRLGEVGFFSSLARLGVRPWYRSRHKWAFGIDLWGEAGIVWLRGHGSMFAIGGIQRAPALGGGVGFRVARSAGPVRLGLALNAGYLHGLIAAVRHSECEFAGCLERKESIDGMHGPWLELNATLRY